MTLPHRTFAQPKRVEQAIPYGFRHLRNLDARNVAMHGGRGGAKSHSFASEALDQGAERPLRILCAREIQRSIASSVKQLLDDKIAAKGMQSFYTSTQYAITGANGTNFIFAGLRTNPESVKSTEGIDIAWVEEANTVSQRSIDLLIPTVRKPGSRLWWSWNRRFITDPVDKMFLGGTPPPRSIIQQVNYDDNPFFPEVLKEEMEWDRQRDMDKYLHVWEGHPLMRSDSKVFKNWRIEDIDDEIPAGCTPRFGADWGFSIDPTVLVKAYVWGRTIYFREEAYKVRCAIDKIPDLFDQVSESRDYRIRADSNRPDLISYMSENGYPKIVSARKGPGSVEEGVSFLQSYDIVVHPDCKHVADEMGLYSYKTDPLTNEVLPELADKDNHVIDSARYALEDIRRGGHQPSIAGALGFLVEG